MHFLSLISLDGSAPPALASLLFDPLEPQNIVCRVGAIWHQMEASEIMSAMRPKLAILGLRWPMVLQGSQPPFVVRCSAANRQLWTPFCEPLCWQNCGGFLPRCVQESRSSHGKRKLSTLHAVLLVSLIIIILPLLYIVVPRASGSQPFSQNIEITEGDLEMGNLAGDPSPAEDGNMGVPGPPVEDRTFTRFACPSYMQPAGMPSWMHLRQKSRQVVQRGWTGL